jgi:hypothetical protein
VPVYRHTTAAGLAGSLRTDLKRPVREDDELRREVLRGDAKGFLGSAARCVFGRNAKGDDLALKTA